MQAFNVNPIVLEEAKQKKVEEAKHLEAKETPNNGQIKTGILSSNPFDPRGPSSDSNRIGNFYGCKD